MSSHHYYYILNVKGIGDKALESIVTGIQVLTFSEGAASLQSGFGGYRRRESPSQSQLERLPY